MHELVRDLYDVILVDYGREIFFVNICDFFVREIACKGPFLLIENADEIVIGHEHRNAAFVINDACYGKLITPVRELFLKIDPIANAKTEFVTESARDIDLSVFEFCIDVHILTAILDAVNGNRFIGSSAASSFDK